MSLLDLETAKTVGRGDRDRARLGPAAAKLHRRRFVGADRLDDRRQAAAPHRLECQVPGSWADGTHRWDGLLRSDEVPKVVDPPSGRIWSANQRAVGGDMLARLGDGCFDLGPRAQQIRDRLLGPRQGDGGRYAGPPARRPGSLPGALARPAAQDADAAGDPGRSTARRAAAPPGVHVDRRASIDSVAYRVVRQFRDALERQVFTSLTGLKDDPTRAPWFLARRRFEGPLWKLVTERPPHLLDPRFASWDAQLLAVADDVLRDLLKIGPRLADRTWGERKHPARQASAELFHPAAQRLARRAGASAPRRPRHAAGHERDLPAPRSGWSSRRATRRTASSICRWGRAAIPCRPTTATATPPGGTASRRRSCPVRRSMS